MDRRIIKPTPTIKSTKTKTTKILMAAVRKPMNAIICLSKVITKVMITTMLPHPAAFALIDMIFENSRLKNAD
jgi:hypothetical protein